LIAMAENMPIDILRVRDDDIPGLVMDGVVDLGIIGENVLEEDQFLAVGDDFRFGASRAGDFLLLQKAGAEYGFAVSSTQTFCEG
ncbi:hypothetical protein MJM45_28695, partial [Salmonella enterica subsp. enterica serovar Kentucky]|nr:hypothetical protein [Salmonella enterica subsp. enterica serovar Kentucky]